MMETLSSVKYPVLRYLLNSPLHSGVKIGPFQRFNALIVYAKKDRRSSDGFSWKRKRPRKKYSFRSEELGDISVLYNKNVVVESTPDLVKTCNEHIDCFIEDRNLSEAQELFNLMHLKEVEQNVFTYTTLMKGYSRVGNTKKVSELFAEMEEKGIRPNEVTFNTTIRSYANNGDLAGAQSLFKKMKNTDGLDPDVYTYSAMLKVCVTARDLETAKKIFSEMMLSDVEANNIVLSSMIDVFAECCNEENGREYLEECRRLVKDMEAKGIKSNEHVYSTLLKLCTRGELTDDAMKILNEMRANHVRTGVVSYSTVLYGISKDQKLSQKEVLELSTEIVKEMKKEGIRPNAASFVSLISVALRLGDLHRADRLFNEMKELKVNPDSVVYGTMIKCHEKLGDPKKRRAYLKPCLDLWQECEQAGMNLTEEGYTTLLSACAKACDMDQASKIWNKMISDKTKPNVSTYSAMINVCVGVGNRDKAIMLFNEMKAGGILPNSVTYATMIKGHEKLGNPKDGEAYLKSCLNILKECERAGIEMDEEGYISLLSACAKAADLNQALKVWKRMLEKNVNLNVSLFNAMINACLSKDNEDEAFDFVDQMKISGIKPDVVTYGTFISHFVKKDDKTGVEKVLNEMKIHAIEPNKAVLRMLKVLGIE